MVDSRSGEEPRLQTTNVWAWSAAHTSGKASWGWISLVQNHKCCAQLSIYKLWCQRESCGMLCWWGPTSPKQLSRAGIFFLLGITWFFLHVYILMVTVASLWSISGVCVLRHKKSVSFLNAGLWLLILYTVSGVFEKCIFLCGLTGSFVYVHWRFLGKMYNYTELEISLTVCWCWWDGSNVEYVAHLWPIPRLIPHRRDGLEFHRLQDRQGWVCKWCAH